MLIEIPKAFLSGFLAAAPIGPVLVLVVQKTLCHSRRGGLMASLGSALIDTAYAAVGLFALGLVKDFISRNQSLLMIAGGFVVSIVGLVMLLKKVPDSTEKGSAKTGTGLSFTFEAMLCALSNPGALFFMMALLALTGLNAATLTVPLPLVLLSVTAGELTYWTVVTFLLTRFVHFKPEMLARVYRYFSIALMALGIAVLVRGIFIL